MSDQDRFGAPGRRFRRTPFWFGLAAGAGLVPILVLVVCSF